MVYADFHVTGSLGEPGSLARFRDYGGGGTPTTWVDGRTRLTGGTDAATRYERAFVESVADSASLSLQVSTLYDPGTRSATVRVSVEVAEEVPRPEECVIQIVLVEDHVASRSRSFDRTVREVMEPEPMLTNRVGSVQTVVRSVAVPSTWDPGELSAIAWVHRSLPNPESTREVLNAAQSPAFGSTPVLESSWGGIKSLWR